MCPIIEARDDEYVDRSHWIARTGVLEVGR
jgi:hypothetical protein